MWVGTDKQRSKLNTDPFSDIDLMIMIMIFTGEKMYNKIIKNV
jgi:hypothetical protein